jgi:hypothetical protein
MAGVRTSSFISLMASSCCSGVSFLKMLLDESCLARGVGAAWRRLRTLRGSRNILAKEPRAPARAKVRDDDSY